jgi:disulfide oxidoreductase YuzD
MDPITTALAAALPMLASDLLKSSVKDAYQALKAVIRRKWGETSPIAKSVDTLEANPKSKGQVIVLAENVAEVNATGDTEVMVALARLLEELKKEGIGEKTLTEYVIDISGGNVQGVIGSKDVSIGSVNFGAPGERRS